MSNINADVLRVFDTAANIAATLRNKQFGFDTTNSRIAVKDVSGTMHYFDKLGTTSDTDILITDNISNAFRVRQSTNEYINISTTDASEAITLGNAGMDITLTLLGTGTTTLGGDLTVGGGMTITATSITDDSGAISFGNENLSTSGTLIIGDLITASSGILINGGVHTGNTIYKDADNGICIKTVVGTSNNLSVLNTAGTGIIFKNPTGTANIEFVGGVVCDSTVAAAGKITAYAGVFIDGGVESNGTIYKSASDGFSVRNVTGTLNDFSLITRSGTYLMTNPTGTQNLEFWGVINAYNHISINDNMRIYLGTDDDVSIYYASSGGHLFIAHESAGNIQIEQNSAGDIYIGTVSGDINLNSSAAITLATTTSGVTISPAGVDAIVCSGTDVDILSGAGGNMTIFDSAASGETPALKISGYKAGDAKRTLSIGISSAVNNQVNFTGLSIYSFDNALTIGGIATMNGGSKHGDNDTAAFGDSSEAIIKFTAADSFLIQAATNDASNGITIENLTASDPINIITNSGTINIGGGPDAINVYGTFTAFGNVYVEDNQDINFGTTTGTIIGNGASQKLAFWGATAVIQYNTTGYTTGFTQGTGTTVYEASTFSGNTGTKNYTIGDIVRALKTAGIIAAS